MRAGAFALAMVAMTGAAAAETIQLYAAGSLKAALTDVAKAFEKTSGNTVQAKFGASGLLKDEIAGGAKARRTRLLSPLARASSGERNSVNRSRMSGRASGTAFDAQQVPRKAG